ncbi:MAG: deoxyribose-phosphate aldolase [Alphaproteobacteria bacterium]|nr:deoxyribose-phosphate aldolase [Alphaproteobacteria bacterium]
MSAGASRVGTGGAAPAAVGHLARYIDHTLLKPTATRADIVKVCEEARAHGFASVCVNSTWIGLVARLLEGSRSMPICVVGFPLGAMSTASKAQETRQAIADGAQEIDMVIDIGALKGGDHDRVHDDIRAVVQAAQGRPVKVILETTMLTRDEKIAGCAISKAAGAHFVKTSTGFGGGGATAEDVALMRAVVGPEMGVKASGGVRNASDAQAMIAAGANRLGASASVEIVTGGTSKGGY